MHLILKKILLYFSEKGEINYLYFTILFSGLILFTFSHFLLLEHPIFGIHLFFLVYAFGQAFLETWVFILITCLLKKWAPRWVLFVFVAFSFLLLLLHFTNFTMIRLMDAPISYAFQFLFGAGIDGFIIGFLALNMNLEMISLMALLLLLIPCTGSLLYWGTNHMTKKKPWNLSINQITLAVLSISMLLLSLDFLMQPYINRRIYKKYRKALPFGTTFLGTTPHSTLLAASIPPLPSELAIKENRPHLSAHSKPNIYLFVIETLRKDFVNEETAPCLTSFGKENIEISSSFANANGTHLSWFSLFYSKLPFYWTAVRDEWNEGSTALQLLKEIGYKIRVYSAADLHYFGMDQVLFGEKKQLINHLEDFSSQRNLDACDKDALCLDTFERDIMTEEGREGNLYLFFLDSTHSEYSFPKDFPLKFEPSVNQIDYLTLNKQEIAPIKNRYRNAISYVDTLMNRFLSRLKEENLYNSAVIAITGDHGEEFFEEGALFHGTHLNKYQTAVPIFLKCTGNPSQAAEATHMDILPSIVHHITGHCDFTNYFDGHSIFTNEGSPYRICVMQKGPETPSEFSIHKGNNKLHAKFFDSKNIYLQKEIEIIEMQMPEEDSNLTQETLINQYSAVLQMN